MDRLVSDAEASNAQSTARRAEFLRLSADSRCTDSEREDALAASNQSRDAHRLAMSKAAAGIQLLHEGDERSNAIARIEVLDCFREVASAIHADPDESAAYEAYIDTAPLPEPSEWDDEPPEGPIDENPRKKSVATELVELAKCRYSLGMSDTGQPFAIDREGPNVALSLRGGSSSIGPKLSAAYYEKHGRATTSAARADCMAVLEGEAMNCAAIELPIRVGEADDGSHVLDLGGPDGRAVRYGPGSWEIIDRSPFTFARTGLTNELPAPVVGGNGKGLDLLRDALNVREDAWRLLVGWLVAALLRSIPHPVLALFGGQGTGKSSATKLIGLLVDPSGAPLRSAPRNEDAWATNASGSWVVPIDNLSSIQPWFSDALCRAVTGDGWVRRRLYTDGDPAVTKFQRCVIMTSIDAGALRGDLAERLLPVELERIDPSRRRTEAEITAAFRPNHGAILGALLDLVVKVLDELPRIELDELPRLADFARVLGALDRVNGWDSLDRFLGIGADLAEDVIEADPVAQAIVKLLDDRGEYHGTAQGLLKEITPEQLPKGWPTTAHHLSGAIKRAAPALRAVGIVVEQGEGRGRRSWSLSRVSGIANTASPASPASPEPLFAPIGDAGDAGDAESLTPDISSGGSAGGVRSLHPLV